MSHVPPNLFVITDEDVRMFHELCTHIYKAVYVSFPFFQLKSLIFSVKKYGQTRDLLLSAHSCSFGLSL